MGGGASCGLGRRVTTAPSGFLSAASGTSPADRGRGDNPSYEGTIAHDATQYDELAAKADRIGEGATEF